MPSNQDIIEERRANLPLPEEPPVQSDWNSANEKTVNVGSGRDAAGADPSVGGGEGSLREPVTGMSDVRADRNVTGTHTAGSEVGRSAVDGLKGIPNDAVTRDAKDKTGTVDTTGKDYGYPEKNDPSKGL